MGQHEFERKLAVAERSGARDRCLELLHYVRKEKMREPRAVASVGKLLVTKHSWGLGDERTYRMRPDMLVQLLFQPVLTRFYR